MKIYFFKNKLHDDYCGVIMSDLILDKIKSYNKKELYENVSENVCCKPKKAFKKFVKKLQKGEFLTNSMYLQDLGEAKTGIAIKSYDLNNQVKTIMFLYKLSLDYDVLELSDIWSRVIDYNPF